MCGWAIQAMSGRPSAYGQTSIAVGRGLPDAAGKTVSLIIEHLGRRLGSDFGLRNPLFFSGAVLTRILPDESPEGDSDTSEGPYTAHVDRARIPSDDYAAVLYLSTQGMDFEGGGFAL